MLGVLEDGLVPFPTGASEAGWHSIDSLYCQKAYQYSTKRKITPLWQNTQPLIIGTLVHIARAQWFADGGGDRWNARMDEYASMHAIAAKDRQIAKAAFTRYVSEQALPTKVLAVEYTVEGLIHGARRTGRFDAIIETTSGVAISELKTTGRQAIDVFEKYELSGQLMLQVELYEQSLAATLGPLAGIQLEVIPLGKDGPTRFWVPITDFARAWFRGTVADMVADAESIAWDSPVRRTVNLRTCHGCSYRRLCLSGPAAASEYLVDGRPMSDWRTGDTTVAPWE